MRYLAAIVTVLVVTTGVLNHDLWNPHEHRDGAITLEMARSADFVVPTLGGRPFLEKPPLGYATGALLVRWLGTDPARTIRAASALYALATLAVVLAMGRILYGRDVAQYAVGMLATTFGFYVVGHFIVTDASLTFFVALALLGFVQFAFANQRRGRVILFLGAAGGFLSKGVIGCALPAIAVTAFALMTRDWKLIWRCLSPTGLLLFVGVIAAWLVPLYQRDGSVHFHEWLAQNVDRFLGKQAGHLHHEQNPAYYLYAFPYICLPWSFAWPFLLRTWWSGGRAWPRRETSFLLAWGCAGLALLSSSLTKRDLYAYPLMAPFALLVARHLVALPMAAAARRLVVAVAVLTLIAVPAIAAAHLVGLTTRPGMRVVVAWGGPLVLAALAIVRSAIRDRSTWTGIAAPALLIAVFNVLVVPARDAVVSLRAPTVSLAAHLNALQNVVTWNMSETLMGAFSFYADLRLRDFDKPRQLAAYLRTTRNAFLMVDQDRLPELAPSVELKPVYRERVGECVLGIYRPRKGKRSGAAR